MASVTQKINNYVLGMSTQPDEQKIPGQVVDLVNGVPDVVTNLTKRPGSSLVNTISPSTAANSKWFHIYTSDTEQYIGQVAADGVVKIWRCSDGVEIPIDYTDIAGTNKATYLDNTGLTDEKSSDIQALTINETTFFVNRRKATAMKSDAADLSPSRFNEAYIELDTIAYGKQYALDIYDPDDNTTYSYTRATGIAVDDAVTFGGQTSPGSELGDGSCEGMGREYVFAESGTDKFGTSPPNMSANGKTNLRYEMDTRCTPQPQNQSGDIQGDDYYDAYAPYAKLQFGGEGWTTNDTHAYTSQKGLTTTITIKNHVTITSRGNVALIRPAPTSSNNEEHVSAAGILGDLKATIDAISGHKLIATIVGNGIHLYRPTPFGVTSPERNLMNVITSEANNIADLPRTCRHGYVVRIVNSGEDMDDYYLRFQAEGIADDISKKATYARATGNAPVVTVTYAGHGLSTGDSIFVDVTSGDARDGYWSPITVVSSSQFTYAEDAQQNSATSGTVTYTPARFGEGVWEEVAAPNVEIEIDNTTMPLRLTRVSPGTQHTIATSAVNTSNERITIANHNMSTGNSVLYHNAGGTSIQGLDSGTVYYAIIVDANTIKLASTVANAEAGTNLGLTGTGNNSQTLTHGPISINGAAYTHLANGAFRFGYPDWGQRDVGDDITNAPPSFIGYPIQKMMFFRNRIALLSAENIILSRVNDFYSFWVKTAMAISNADPIDLQSSSTYPTKLYDAQEANTGLVLFSANEQFLLSSGAEALLTPETAKVTYLSSYAFNQNTTPISLGTTIGFLNSTAKNARFYEIANVNAREEPDVIEQSKIIGELFPTTATTISESNENDLILFGTDSTLHTATNELWGYKYYQQGQKRAQSAWFRWTMPNNIIYHTILDDVCYVVLNTGSTYTFEKFDIKLKADTDLIGDEPDVNRVFLDTKKTIASGDITYNSQTDVSTFTLGAGYYSSRTLTAYCITDSDARGKSYDIPAAKITGTAPNETVTLPGNWKTSTKDGSAVNTDLIIGYEYEFEVEFPKIYMTRAEGEKIRSETRGSLVLHRMNFDFGDVGVIDVTLKRRGRADYTYTVESLEWDNINASKPAIAPNYLHTIPVYDRNINTSVFLKSNHPSPATIHSMNWEGDFSPRYYQRV